MVLFFALQLGSYIMRSTINLDDALMEKARLFDLLPFVSAFIS